MLTTKSLVSTCHHTFDPIYPLCSPSLCVQTVQKPTVFPQCLPLLHLHRSCERIKVLPNSQICFIRSRHSMACSPHSSQALWKVKVNHASEPPNLGCFPTLCQGQAQVLGEVTAHSDPFSTARPSQPLHSPLLSGMLGALPPLEVCSFGPSAWDILTQISTLAHFSLPLCPCSDTPFSMIPTVTIRFTLALTASNLRYCFPFSDRIFHLVIYQINIMRK